MIIKHASTTLLLLLATLAANATASDASSTNLRGAQIKKQHDEEKPPQSNYTCPAGHLGRHVTIDFDTWSVGDAPSYLGYGIAVQGLGRNCMGKLVHDTHNQAVIYDWSQNDNDNNDLRRMTSQPQTKGKVLMIRGNNNSAAAAAAATTTTTTTVTVTDEQEPELLLPSQCGGQLEFTFEYQTAMVHGFDLLNFPPDSPGTTVTVEYDPNNAEYDQTYVIPPSHHGSSRVWLTAADPAPLGLSKLTLDWRGPGAVDDLHFFVCQPVSILAFLSGDPQHRLL